MNFSYIFLYLSLFFTVKGLRPFDRHPRECINLTSVCVCSGVCVEGIRASLNIILAVNLEWLEREWMIAVRQSNDRPFASKKRKKKYTYIPANRNDPTCVIASTRKNFLHIHIVECIRACANRSIHFHRSPFPQLKISSY